MCLATGAHNQRKRCISNKHTSTHAQLRTTASQQRQTQSYKPSIARCLFTSSMTVDCPNTGAHGCFMCPLSCALEVLKRKHPAILCWQTFTSIPRTAAKAFETPADHADRRCNTQHVGDSDCLHRQSSFTLSARPHTAATRTGQLRERSDGTNSLLGHLE